MKKIWDFILKYKVVIIFTILIGVIFHLPLFTKELLTGDVLLNTGYYSGYSWEISLGRFGLYFTGLLKGFLVVKHLEVILGIFLLTASMILIFELLHIKKIGYQLLCSTLCVFFPVISCTLLFHYCSFSYFLAFFCGVLAIYLMISSNHLFLRYVVPIGLIVFSLSIYQAYLSVILTLLFLIGIIQLSKNTFSWKKFLISLGVIILSSLLYFIFMKLSLVIFDVNISSYKNANNASLQFLLHLPSNILSAYKEFYQFYFTDTIVNNSNVFLPLFNFLFLLLLVISSMVFCIKRKISWKNILLMLVFFALIPVCINVITVILPGTKMQILQCCGYLLLFFLLCYFISHEKVLSILSICCLLFMMRGYIIQDQATYQTLEMTYQKTYSIASDIKEEIQQMGYQKEIMIAGDIGKNIYYNMNNKTELGQISKLTYGYVSTYPLFWSEYTNIKNGWSRFMEQYLGFPISFVNLDTYQKILESEEYKDMKCYPDKGSVQEIDGVIVIKFSN